MAKILEVPEIEGPFTDAFYAINVDWPQYLFLGIRSLVAKGMLRHVREDNFDIFFPTPALTSRIMEKQGITAN
jgi:hypothetical protein